MSAHAHRKLTAEEYLEIERAAQFKSEYYDGQMYVMSGASLRHAIIIGNLSGELHNALKKRGCNVVTNDLRLKVNSGRLFAYPDVIVLCELTDDHNDTLINPTVIAEVLSRSTELYDRGLKSTNYRTIDSLQEYALLSQNEPRIEVYRRQPAGGWLLTEFAGLEAVCRFDSLDCGVALSEIYHNVAFPETTDPEPSLRSSRLPARFVK